MFEYSATDGVEVTADRCRNALAALRSAAFALPAALPLGRFRVTARRVDLRDRKRDAFSFGLGDDVLRRHGIGLTADPSRLVDLGRLRGVFRFWHAREANTVRNTRSRARRFPRVMRKIRVPDLIERDAQAEYAGRRRVP